MGDGTRDSGGGNVMRDAYGTVDARLNHVAMSGEQFGAISSAA
jgi:hypothetical protein